MKKICQLFGINWVQFLTKRSNGVFNIFTRTLKKLQELNKYIEDHKAEKIEAIKHHQDEHDQLHSQLQANNKVISKINDFLNN